MRSLYIQAAALLLLFIFCYQKALSAEVIDTKLVEVKFPKCVTVQVDIEGLNNLNRHALEIFPFVLEEPQIPGVQKVSLEDYRKNLEIAEERSDFKDQYQKLIRNIDAFLLSGGVMIAGKDKELESDKYYISCYIYMGSNYSEDSEKSFEVLFSKIPSLSPILVGAVASNMIFSGQHHQSEMLGRAADAAYFLIFGYNSWGAKNRKESAAYEHIIKCAENQLNASEEVNSACHEIQRTPKYQIYKKFLTSSILTATFAYGYARQKEFNGLPFGAFGSFLRQVSENFEQMRERVWNGGLAFSLVRGTSRMLSEYYREHNPKIDNESK